MIKGVMLDGAMVAGLSFYPEIATIPIGRGVFQMGSVEITISAFELGRDPITNDQYARFMNQLGKDRFFGLIEDPQIVSGFKLFARGRSRQALLKFNSNMKVVEVPPHKPPERFDRPNQPAVGVNWYGAFIFAELLNMLTDGAVGAFGLPTEFQWELAAQIPKGWQYVEALRTKEGEVGAQPIVLDPKKIHCRHPDDNEGAKIKRKFPKSVDATFDVDMEGRIHFGNGLRWMLGQVAEWQANWFGPISFGAMTDPPGPRTGTQRSLRGSSWDNAAAWAVRPESRDADFPETANNEIGFRVALNI